MDPTRYRSVIDTGTAADFVELLWWESGGDHLGELRPAAGGALWFLVHGTDAINTRY